MPEFYAWATMSENVTVASDGVFDLNGLNIERAVETHPHQLVVNFYAPWCKWSQSMLPRFAEANAHVAALVAEGLLPHGTAMGKVDVDVSTDLRHAHGVNTYVERGRWCCWCCYVLLLRDCCARHDCSRPCTNYYRCCYAAATTTTITTNELTSPLSDTLP